MKRPLIDLVIAAHDPARRVDRAVASVLSAAPNADVRVTVVVHGLPTSAFDDVLGTLLEDPRLRVVELIDGIRSPAGPFNRGLELATAEYVGVMGSDDFLEPGTPDAWASHVREHRPDFLMASLRDQHGGLWREPLARPGRLRNLDPVRDRLNYRTAPLGLIRREFLDRLGINFTPGFASGEDIELGLAVLNRGAVNSGLGMPAYVIGNDAPQRITLEKRTYAEEIAPLLRLQQVPWLDALPVTQRNAIGIKLWRMSVIDSLKSRGPDEAWVTEDLTALGSFSGWLNSFAPQALSSMSRSDLPLIHASFTPTAAGIAEAIGAHNSASPFEWALTEKWWNSMQVDTRVRRLIRSKMPI